MSNFKFKGIPLSDVINTTGGTPATGYGFNYNTTSFAKLQIPYASKLLMQELETMNIGSRLITSQKLITHKDTP